MENKKKKKKHYSEKNPDLGLLSYRKNAAVPVVESVGSVLFGRVSRDPVQPNFRCSNCPPPPQHVKSYCMSKKFSPFLHSESLYKNGQDFLDLRLHVHYQRSALTL